jgi:putative peptide zinc metalloprotease protein
MNAVPDHRRAAADRMLAVHARRDLQSVEVEFGGQQSYVVKDPVGDEIFHFSAEEHRLLVALRQPVSLRDLKRIFESEFAPGRASVSQIQQFVNRLYDQGLLVSDSPGLGAELAARGRERRRRARWAGLLQLLAIRVGGFTAAPLIERLYRALCWAFSPWALAAYFVVLGYAAITVIANAPIIATRLPALGALVTPNRLPLWIATIAAVKTLHELGHALVCRHFGARPQEMGVLLLAGAPALYCDASDAWRLPSKWRRMTISAAGMAVELLIAAIAIIVWAQAAPGLLAAVCLSLIVVCSVGTIAVNANPLLRYDGYYLLADWLEVPNLGERARGLISGAWRRWLLGEPTPDDPFVGPGKRRALWIYATASKVYLAVVLVGIFVLMLRLARSHHLENAVYTIAAITLVGLLAHPIIAATRLWANPSVRARLIWPRVAATLIMFALTAAAAWWWPMTRRVAAPLVVVPANAHPLFALTDGELKFVAPPGAWVEKGAVVAQLANPELELALVAQEGAVRERRLRLEHLRTLQAMLPAAAHMLPTASAELADAEAQLAEQQSMVESLVIRAPAGGRVLAPPPRLIERAAADTLRRWSGSPLAPRNRGAWIEQGTPLAVIAEPGGWIAWAGVDQADITAVEPGQAVRLLVDELPTTILSGLVTQVSRRASDNHSADAANADAAGSAELLGNERYHVVEIALDSDSAGAAAGSPRSATAGLPSSGRQVTLLAGARGTAKITAHASTLGQIAWRRLRQLFTRTL